jgi:ribosomal protein L16 Arg81 hydroxylase
LQKEFNFRTIGELFLTPKNQEALLLHYDTHDVFVLQIHGKKRWKLYNADYKTPVLNSVQPIFQREQLNGERDIAVSVEEMRYIPRSVPHEGFTSDESSLHLTIGVYPTQWMDLLTKAIHHLAHSQLELRQSLPLGFFK